MTTPRDIVKLAHDLAGQSDRTITAALQGFDVETKIAVRHQIAAQAEERRISASGLATDDQPPLGTMRTDTTAPRADVPLSPEMRVLLRKARLDPTRSYSQGELNDVLDRSGLDVESRLAIKIQMADMGQHRASGARPSVQAGRDMSASTERPRGKVLLDPVTRQPAVLRSQPV